MWHSHIFFPLSISALVIFSMGRLQNGCIQKRTQPFPTLSVRCIANFFVNNKIRNPMELLDIQQMDHLHFIMGRLHNERTQKRIQPSLLFSVRCIANFFVNNKIRNPMELLDIQQMDHLHFIMGHLHNQRTQKRIQPSLQRFYGTQ